MAVDLALDRATGDIRIANNDDIAIVTGQDVIDQRIRVRLRVPHGDWETNLAMGEEELELGSRLPDMARLPTWRALDEIPLVVKEALAPMPDIRVDEVTCEVDKDDPRVVGFTVIYTVIEDDLESDMLTFDGSVGVAG